MARHTYTADELRHLRASPLVQRPDSLPAIEQWIDPPQERETTQRKTSGRAPNGRSTDDSGPMGNFGSQRPAILQTRQTRASGEDIVLGPPKTSFVSSRNLRRTDDGDEKSSLTNNEGDDFSPEPMSARTRNFNDEDGMKRRGFGMDDKDKDGWVMARKGRGYENRPGEKDRLFGRGTRERGDRQAITGDEAGRRNGFNARDEPRWPREGDERKPTRTPGRETGWRDRERRPEYTRDAHSEREPEWMDEPASDEPVARTAAEFEQWKAKMKGSKAEEVKEQDISTLEKSPGLPKSSVSLFADSTFGTWGDTKKHEVPAKQEPTPTTPAAGKKASRFASMFAPKEEPRPVMPDPVPEPTPPASAPPNADQEAFQRMLFKLRATSVTSPQDGASTAKQPSQGLSSGFGPQSAGALENRTSPNPLIQHMLLSKSDSRPGSTVESSTEQSQTAQQGRQIHNQQQPQGHAPTRETLTPEAHSLHAMMSGQSQPERKTPALSKDSEFLLNLIQMKSANRPPQAAQQEPDPNFQLFLDQPPRAPNQSLPPQSRPQHPLGHIPTPDHPFSPIRGVNEPHDGRRAGAQPPPGFFDGLPPQQQRRPPGFGPPPPLPEFFHHDPNQPPPPGFMPGMHPHHHPNPHAPPPGMPGMPNMFASPPPPHMLHQQQHQQQQPQQRGPPGLPGGDHLFGPGSGIAPPPGFPQGFMPPPGFAGPLPSHPHGIGRGRMEMLPGAGPGMQQDRGNAVGRGR